MSADPMADEIGRFLAWMDQHGAERAQLDGGVLASPGCSGDFGCCAETYNLEDLADVLRDLTTTKKKDGST